MKLKYIMFVFFVALFGCEKRTHKEISKIKYMNFGYDYSVFNLKTIKSSYFLWREKKLYQISSQHKDTTEIQNYTTNVINYLSDSLPVIKFKKNNIVIGDLISENDSAPWFVFIVYDNNKELKIMSNNLPESFKNYNNLVIKILQELYNKNY